MVERGMAAMAAPAAEAAPAPAAPAPAPKVATEGSLTYQVLERELRPGEVSLDDLERAFRETEAAPPPPPAPPPAPPKAEVSAAPAPRAEAPKTEAPKTEAPKAEADKPAADKAAKPAAAKKAKTAVEVDAGGDADRVATQSIRVNVDTLEHLMTMVS